MTALDVTTTPQRHTWDRPRPILWLHTIIRRGPLDRMLAEGRDPTRDARLALRARQLVEPSRRARLAVALHDAVQSAEEPQRSRFPAAQIPVAAAAVRGCSSELRDLAHALTGPHPRVRGVALARELLTDGAGPLYTCATVGELRGRIYTARSAL